MGLLNNSLKNLERALAALVLACETPVAEARDLAGIVKSFEFVFELSWKSVQSMALKNGVEVSSPRAAFREAFKLGYVDDPKVWVDIFEDRNRTVHTYDEDFAKEMSDRIRLQYLVAFQGLFARLKQREKDDRLESF
jgi:nucleotidyltransferase substrate binding protein (TIGR01987 family)